MKIVHYIRKNKTQYILLLLLTACVFFSYRGIFSTFFQQDEWQAYGHRVALGIRIILDSGNGFSFINLIVADGRFLSRIVFFILYAIGKFSLMPLFTFNIVVQTVNAFLVFKLGNKLSKKNFIGIAASFFFAVNSVSAEAITWAAAANTLYATFFVLLSLLYFVDFLDSQNVHKKNFSFLFAILSLYFKEIGLFLFIFYPVLYIFWKKKGNFRQIISVHVPLFLYGAVLLLYRISVLVFAQKNTSGYEGFVGGTGSSFGLPVLYHLVVYPLTSFFQVFIPSGLLYRFVPWVLSNEYPYLVGPFFDLVGQSIVADLISLLGTLLILGAITGMVFLAKETRSNKRLVLFGVLLSLFSYFPYAVLHRPFSYLSGRYYYVGVIGASYIFGYALFWLMKRLPRICTIIFVLGASFYLFYQVQTINKDLEFQISLASVRKAFLQEIKKVHQKLEKKTVFYIFGDKQYLGPYTYPFQNGLGYILEVWYYESGNVPKIFLIGNFLWDLGAEGYKTSGPYGFGYFEHMDKLAQEVTENKISPDIVYAYSWNSTSLTFDDITSSVREQLATLSAELQ